MCTYLGGRGGVKILPYIYTFLEFNFPRKNEKKKQYSKSASPHRRGNGGPPLKKKHHGPHTKKSKNYVMFKDWRI
jgi:hypothetical protein